MQNTKVTVEYRKYVKEDLMNIYKIDQDEALHLIKKYNFDKMMQAAPDYILHYNTEDWARKIYNNDTLQTV